jgi:hypothetical protein
MLNVTTPNKLQIVFDAAALTQRPGARIIRDPVIAGGRVHNNMVYDGALLAATDMMYLMTAVPMLARHNIFIDPEARLRVANIAYDPAHDILRDGIAADMLFYSYIFYERSIFDGNGKSDESGLLMMPRDDHAFARRHPAHLQSRLAASTRRWSESLDHINPQVAVNVRAPKNQPSYELPTEFLTRGAFYEATHYSDCAINKVPVVDDDGGYAPYGPRSYSILLPRP